VLLRIMLLRKMRPHGKFLLHLPLGRQSEACRREGVEIDEATLADWVGSTVLALDPIVQARRHLCSERRAHSCG
jgi:transposase